MQTKLIARLKDSSAGQEAEAILRSCVHCGFCNATCPTFQLTGNELDGPRGRIYLIKQLLEGQPVGEATQHHLDRCLSCRACETTCPSGVQYHRLLDIGREVLTSQRPRSWWQRQRRRWLARVLLHKRSFAALVGAAARVRQIMPRPWLAWLPARHEALSAQWAISHQPKVDAASQWLLLQGCVQDALAPDIHRATRMVLELFGHHVFTVDDAQCCGAIEFHLDANERARHRIKANIDAWWPQIEAGTIAGILVNASGCGAFAKDYATLLRDDPVYAEKAARVAALIRDPVEVLSGLDWPAALEAAGIELPLSREALVFHPPCSLQHGQGVRGDVEHILGLLGAQLKPLANAHICCGSAGTYALLQTDMAEQLKEEKWQHLLQSGASRVVTANIGCQSHLASGGKRPVMHWLEWVAEVLTAARSEASEP